VSFRGAAAAALWLAATAWAQDKPAPLKDDPTPSRVPRVSVFVPPDYPEGALKDSATAVVDVLGKVREDGTLDLDRVDVTPERDDFRAAVKKVAPYWIFSPRYDSRCEAIVDEKQFRIWFELKDGKPAISISGVTTGKVPTDPSQDALFTPLNRVDPIYPHQAQLEGREGIVEALIRIAEDGHIEKVVIVPGGNGQFFGAAITKARRARAQAVGHSAARRA
jgi:hypothetical protein